MIVLSIQLRAVVLILFVLLIRSLFLYKLPKKIFMGMWALVLIRLLVPYIGQVSLGMYLPNPENLLLHFFNVLQSPVDPVQTGIVLTTFTIPWYVWCVCIAGSLLLAAYFLWGHIRWRRIYRFAYPVQSEAVSQWMRENKLRRKVRVLQSADVSSALTYGIFRPVILLPSSMDLENRERLPFLLSHELAHIKHFDILWKCASLLTVCLYWYNPVVWAMYILMNRDMELRCDECVLKQYGTSKQTKSQYALTLLELAEEKRTGFSLANYFGKSATEERIVSIMHSRRAHAWLQWMAILFILLIALWAFYTFAINVDYITLPLTL